MNRDVEKLTAEANARASAAFSFSLFARTSDRLASCRDDLDAIADSTSGVALRCLERESRCTSHDDTADACVCWSVDEAEVAR